MLRARSRVLLRFAAASILMLAAANSASGGAIIGPLDQHREAVDELRYPWSSIGKLYNETGGSCSGVVISRDKILTAAHCLFNDRTRRFIPAEALHFLVGYRTGRYSAHARVASYEIGAGFDPLRYDQTSEADWAVLTVTESLPAEIEPLRLRREPVAERHQGRAGGLSAGSRLRHDRRPRLRIAGQDQRRPAAAAHLPGHQRLFRRADPGQHRRPRDAGRRHPDRHRCKATARKR